MASSLVGFVGKLSQTITGYSFYRTYCSISMNIIIRKTMQSRIRVMKELRKRRVNFEQLLISRFSHLIPAGSGAGCTLRTLPWNHFLLALQQQLQQESTSLEKGLKRNSLKIRSLSFILSNVTNADTSISPDLSNFTLIRVLIFLCLRCFLFHF